MDIIQKVLRDIGLHPIEGEIYFSCYKYGRLSVGGMTRWVDHPRTTIYGYVEKMVEKHVLIVEKTPRGNAYRAASADELIVLLKNQQATTEALIEKVEYMKPALQELARHVEYIPKVQYYEGAETIALMYERINKAKERRFISDMDAIAEWMQWTSVDHMVKAFTHTSGFSWEILLDTPLARTYAKAKDAYHKKSRKKKNYEIVFMPISQERCKSDNIYIDGTYFHIAYGDYLVGIEINNPIYYTTQKMMFDHLWEKFS